MPHQKIVEISTLLGDHAGIELGNIMIIYDS